MSSVGQKDRWASCYQLSREQFDQLMGLVKLDTNPLHDAAYKALGPKGIVAISKA